ncbi:MAG TPA: MFS transporter [Dehalococcoidia bacterium]|nr:MFS transporter [Dehalococcoidia bacterium]
MYYSYLTMSPPTSNNWTNLALLRLNAFGVGINGFYLAIDTVVLPVLVLILAPEALKNTYLAALGLSGLLVAGVIQVIVGRLSDRTRSPLGRRVPYLLGGSVLICLGMVGIGLAPTFWLLFAVWLFIQANINVSYGPYQALIQDLVPGARTGVASAFKILADVVGGVAFIKISTVFMGQYAFGDSIEWLWITLGVLGINLLVAAGITSATVLTRQKKPGSVSRANGRPAAQSSGLHSQLTLFLISRWFMVTAVIVFQTYGLFFLRDKVGLETPVQALGNMVLVVGGAVAAGAYLAGWFSDRIGRKPVILAGAAGAALSTATILLAGSTTEVLVIATFIGFSVGALLSSNWALANEMGTAGKEALHMGVVNLATIAGAASAKMLGPGVDLLNRASPASGYSALLIGCAVMFVLGGILLMPLKTNSHST